MNKETVSTRVLAGLMEERTGQKFGPSRSWRFDNALTSLYREHGLASIDQLALHLQQSRGTTLEDKVVDALLNNETYFYRDRAMFDDLIGKALPELQKKRADRKRISIWSAGCSTGQEALSLAMTFAEQEARWAGWTIDILGTDVSSGIVEEARRGVYTPFQIQRGLGITQMLRWFDETPDGWQANDALRRMVRFERHNLLDAPPSSTSFDIILCRNVLLYFDADNRDRAFERIASAIASDGWLMLGAGETVVRQTKRFVPDPAGSSLYRPHRKA
jgi:chemotaxis protein methyltransferase CheR